MVACRRAMKAQGRPVPLQVQVTIETTGRMLVGSEIGAGLTSLLAMKPDVLGINCATGPAEMQEHLRYLSQHSPVPISVLPNAGLPSVVDGRTHYDLTEAELARFHSHHVADLGIGIVGGCCGTTPAHLAAVVEAVKDLEPARRSPSYEPSVTSIYAPVTIAQDLSFLIIGERTNANGSKAFREAMLAEDWDGCTRDGDRADPRGRPRARRLRRLRRPRRRPGHGRDRPPLRHAGQRPARHRLDRATGDGGRPAPHRRPGHPQLRQPRGRRAARQPAGPRDVAGPRVRLRGDLPAHRRAGPGPGRRVEAGGRPPHPPDRRRSATGSRRPTSSSTR